MVTRTEGTAPLCDRSFSPKRSPGLQNASLLWPPDQRGINVIPSHGPQLPQGASKALGPTRSLC